MKKGKNNISLNNSNANRKEEIARLMGKTKQGKTAQDNSKDVEEAAVSKAYEAPSGVESIEELKKQIQKMEKEIQDRESKLQFQEEKLSTELSILKENKEKYTQESAKLKADKAEAAMELKKNEADRIANEKKLNELLNKERMLFERETNAENGFVLQNENTLEIMKKREAEIRKNIEKLTKEQIQKEMEIDNGLQAYRQSKAEQIDKEMENMLKNRKAEIEKTIAQIERTSRENIDHEESLLQSKLEEFRKRDAEVSKQKIELETKKNEFENDYANFQFEKRMFDDERRLAKETIDTQVARGIQDFKYEMERAKEEIEYYRAKLEAAEERITEYERTDRESGGMSKEELNILLNEQKKANEQLRKEKALMPQESLFIEYEAKAKAFEELQREFKLVRAEFADIKSKEHQWEKTTNLLQIEREKCDQLEKRREALEATLIKYSEEVNRFKSLYEQPKELASRIDMIKKPYLGKKNFGQVLSEMDWLERIYERCIDSGIYFSKRLLYSFHTSLKTAGWSPLTVLAGVSGTGKSLLPEYYCRYGGIYFYAMAVQPDWDSPQSLFGYFNSVDNRFNATHLLRSMTQFSTSSEELNKESNLSDYMFLVLLDEMNLAHVELYFSDMLSKLERRRNTNDNVCVEIDLGAGMEKYELELNENMLWVGTMNEDETTKSLSDKVLDRGNLISFPRPTEFVSRTKVTNCDEALMLPKSIWNSWIDESIIENDNFKKSMEGYKKGLEQINEALEFAGRALGHRVWQSIENYMANHPKVIDAYKNDRDDKKNCLQEAFEEALVHKVMPKLRGIETTGEMKTKCLDKISDILIGSGGLAPGLQYDFNNALSSAYESFLWKSAKYLEIEE